MDKVDTKCHNLFGDRVRDRVKIRVRLKIRVRVRVMIRGRVRDTVKVKIRIGIRAVAPWEHSFWGGGQSFKFSDDETFFPTKPTVVNPLLMSCFSRYHDSS